MKAFLQGINPIILLIIATVMEVSGDALIRKTIYNYTGFTRISFALVGAVLLFGYGFFVNIGPIEFSKVVGLYIATLFIVWQIISYITFRSVPTLPVILGGMLIVSGGLLITFWKSN